MYHIFARDLTGHRAPLRNDEYDGTYVASFPDYMTASSVARIHVRGLGMGWSVFVLRSDYGEMTLVERIA